jgi:hypothetical protein
MTPHSSNFPFQESALNKTMSSLRPQPILLLNGYPATGKLTIARHLLAFLEESSFPAKLVHHHLQIDLADAVLPRSSLAYPSLRRALREDILASIATAPETFGDVYIFTEFQSNNELGSTVLAEYADAARRCGRTFIQVNLECGVEENVRRMLSEERMNGSPGKLMDIETLRKWRERAKLGRCDSKEGDVQFNSLEVGWMDAQQAAFKVLELLGESCPLTEH